MWCYNHEATYILLGRHKQFVRKVLHNDLVNEFSFECKRHKVTLKPLTPR